MDCRRGPVGLWAYRRRDVGLPAAGDRAGHRDSRQAHGQRLPVAAVITRRDLAAKFSDADWFSTFGGNPVAMAAAKAVLEVVDDERIVDNARDVGEYLGTRLREIAAQSPVVGEVRQIGLAIGVEIVRPGTTEPDPATANDIVNGMQDAGILIDGPPQQRAQDPPAVGTSAPTRGSAVETLASFI